MAQLNFFKRQKALLATSHDVIRNVDPFDFQVAHKRLAWMTRLLAGGLFASLIFNGILVNSIASLFPLKEVQIALLRADPADNRIYRVEPISKDVPGYDLFMEMAVRNFTASVLAIDSVGAKPEIIATLDTFATSEFNKKFYRQRAAAVDEAIEAGLNRSITIESAALIGNYEGVRNYSVDFVQTDKRNGKIVENRTLRAVLKVTTQPNTVKTKDKFNNPHGIRVMDMVLKERPAL